ncbi:Midasin [Galdieria sulphuraria]|nr:Midasin [Galdieria sulphuraria]
MMASRYDRYLKAIVVSNNANENLKDLAKDRSWKEFVTSSIESFLQVFEKDKTSFYEALSCLQVPELVEVFAVTLHLFRHCRNKLSKRRQKLFGVLVRVSIVSGKHSQLFQLFLYLARRNCFVGLWSEYSGRAETSLGDICAVRRELALIAYYWNSYDLNGLFPWECIIQAAASGDKEAKIVFSWLFNNSDCLESERWTGLNSDWSVWKELDLLEYTKRCILLNISLEKVVDTVDCEHVSGPLEFRCSPELGLSHVCDFPLISPHIIFNNDILMGDKRFVVSNFVLLEHFIPVIYDCLECIAMGIPVMLEGPAGSGKSALLQLLSQIREQREVIYSHDMDEKKLSLPQTITLCMSGCRGFEDFDELVGNIVPHAESEGFVWKAGPIGVAIEGGHWLVLEDLHNTSNATCYGIERLVELRAGEKLEVSGRKRPLEAAFGFHLFGVRTCDDNCCDTNEQHSYECQSSWEPPGGSWKWKRIHLPNLLQNERDGRLYKILQSRFPCLSFCHHRLASTIFELLRIYREKILSRLCRPATLTDLIRICTRLEYLQLRGEILSTEMAVCECLDVLCSWDPDKNRRSRVYSVLSEAWSIPFDTVKYFDIIVRPQWNTTSQVTGITRLGRAQWTNENNINIFQATIKVSNGCSWMSHTLRLWERIARCVEMKEPVLLCGETGTGKTSAIQEMAKMMGVSVVVLNLSPQTEWNDLIGTYRPHHPFQDVQHLSQLFLDAFCPSFGTERNQTFLHNLDSALKNKDIDRCYRLIVGAWKKIEQSVSLASLESSRHEKWNIFREYLSQFKKVYGDTESNFHLKKRKRKDALEWNEGSSRNNNSITFRFQAGPLISAMKEGHWILLDEINLAPFEILEELSMLLERGMLPVLNDISSCENRDMAENTYLKAHPNFRIFAAMNPPTDVGKRDLRLSIRKKFTEIYVDENLEEEDLIILISKRYFGRSREDCTDEEYCIVQDVVRFYLSSRKLCENQYLVDANGRKPHYSLRALCRTLDLAQCIYCRMKSVGSAWMRHKRALYEGASLSFISPLPFSCRSFIEKLADEIFLAGNSLRDKKMSELVKVPTSLSDGYCFIEMEGYWLLSQHSTHLDHYRNSLKSSKVSVDEGDNQFITTPSVKHTMRDILRTLQYGVPKYAVLLQGPTASGKTSLVSYLARTTGQTLLRINHHEHMDLSEYLGSFQMDDTGSFHFVQGPLLKAVRLGFWVVLDELNLAPNELLEALNRLLDDNREIYVPELAQTFRAHENFVLFATQNPSGEYAGRKQLSRAFRGRFIELNVGELPMEELNVILQRRYRLPLSFTERMIRVMHELQVQRTRERVFLGKESLISARDLFRWASRSPDSKESLAKEGFFLLGERCRTTESREFIRKVLIDSIGVSSEVLKDEHLYEEEQNNEKWMPVLAKLNLVPTPSLFRMIALVKRAFEHQESVLLIGETGIGKTTCIQVLAEYENNFLWTVSCHRHLDVSDFIGAFRPRRKSDSSKLFEWVDGPLVSAMKGGNYFLLDEVNMASDAVIERLNSVLEPERTLTEYKSCCSTQDSSHSSSHNLTAHSQFCFVAAMNPASDYGKKECSIAFRSRLTEIWVPPNNAVEEYVGFIANAWSKQSPLHVYVKPMQELVICVLNDMDSSPPLERQLLYSMFTWRDIRAWMHFIESSREIFQHPFSSYAHGFDLILLDGLKVSSLSHSSHLERLVEKWKTLLLKQCQERMCFEEIQQELYIQGLSKQTIPIREEEEAYRFGNLKLNKVNADIESDQQNILSVVSLETDTMRRNSFRIVRAMLLKKPILLQGPPGIGKTSMIQALASLCGQRLLRVNLSEHTEMSDLIGMDVPSNHQNDESNAPFVFRPGPLLVALQRGYWILLDELNLAPQTVLEGLNSLLDHRRSIYVAELDKEFYADDQPHFMLFATQNPAVDGSGRKQLPRSFLSRFTRVAMEQLHLEDMCQIAEKRFPKLNRSFIRKGLQVLGNIQQCRKENEPQELTASNMETREHMKLLLSGQDLNLRDILRWFSCVEEHVELIGDFDVASYLFFENLIIERLGMDVHDLAMEKYGQVFDTPTSIQQKIPSFTIYRKDKYLIQAGPVEIVWHKDWSEEEESLATFSRTREEVRWMETYRKSSWTLSIGVLHDWPMIVIGKRGSGRKSLIRTLSNIFGQRLVEWNQSGMDTDGGNFVGSYQVFDAWETLWDILQVDVISRCNQILGAIFVEEKQQEKIVKDLYFVSKWVRELCLELHNKGSNKFDWMDYELTKVIGFFDQLSKDVMNPKILHWIVSLRRKLEECLHIHKNDKKCVSMFQWVYSSFIKAARRGDWIMIDEAHRYPPAILDALNPFLEDSVSGTNRTLWLPSTVDGEERESFHIHPRFRIFFVVEQGKQHQLSKALWNRALITHLPDLTGSEMNNVTTINNMTNPLTLKDVFKLSCNSIERSVFSCSSFSYPEENIVHMTYYWWTMMSRRKSWPDLKDIGSDRRWSCIFGLLHSMGKPSYLGIPEDSLLAQVYWICIDKEDSLSPTEEYQWLQQWLESKMPHKYQNSDKLVLLKKYPVLCLSEFFLQMSVWATYYSNYERWMPLVTQFVEFYRCHIVEERYLSLVNSMSNFVTQSPQRESMSYCMSRDEMIGWLVKEGIVYLPQVLRGEYVVMENENFLNQTVLLLEYLWDVEMVKKMDTSSLPFFTVGYWTLIQCIYGYPNEVEPIVMLSLFSFLQQALKELLLASGAFQEIISQERVRDWLHQCDQVLLSVGGWKLQFLQSYHLFEPLYVSKRMQEANIGSLEYLDSQNAKAISRQYQVQFRTWLRSQQVLDADVDIPSEWLSSLSVDFFESILIPYENELVFICQETRMVFTIWHFWTSILFWNGALESCSKQLPIEWLNMVSTFPSSDWNMECLISQQQLIWLFDCNSKSRVKWQQAWIQHFLAQGSLSVILWLFQNRNSFHRMSCLENGWMYLLSSSLRCDWQRSICIENNIYSLNALGYSLQLHHSKQFLNQMLDIICSLRDERVFQPHDLFVKMYNVQVELWKQTYLNDSSDMQSFQSADFNFHICEEANRSLFSIGEKWFMMGRQHLEECVLFRSKYHPRKVGQSIQSWKQVLEEMSYFRFFHFLQDESYISLWQCFCENILSTSCNLASYSDLVEEYPQLVQAFLSMASDLLSSQRLDYYQHEIWKLGKKGMEGKDISSVLQELNQWQTNLSHGLIQLSEVSKDWGLIDQVLVAGYEILVGSYLMTRDFYFQLPIGGCGDVSDNVPSPICPISSLPSKCVAWSLQYENSNFNLSISQLMTLKWLYFLRMEPVVSQVTIHGISQVHKYLGQIIGHFGLRSHFVQPNEMNQAPISWNFQEKAEDVWFDEESRESWDKLYLQAHLLEDMTSEHSWESSKQQLEKSKRHIWFIQLIIGLLTQWSPQQSSSCKQQLQRIYSFANCAARQESRQEDIKDDPSRLINEFDYWDLGGWILLFGMEGEITPMDSTQVLRKSCFQFYQDLMPNEIVQLDEPWKQTYKFVKQYHQSTEHLAYKSLLNTVEEDLVRIQQLSRKTPMIRIAQLVKQWKDHLILWQKQWLGKEHPIGKVIAQLQCILDKWNKWIMQHWQKEWIEWREEKLQMDSIDYFLPLYIFLSHSLQSSVCREDVMQVMDFFLRTAQIADFSLRVNIVKSFYLLFQWKKDDSTTSWLANLLRGIYCYYQQYERRIQKDYEERRKTALDKIQRNIEYAYQYSQTSAEELESRFGFPIGLRQKAVQIGRELERSLSDSIAPLLKDDMENGYQRDSRAKQLSANLFESLSNREIWHRDWDDVMSFSWCEKTSYLLNVWKKSFHVWEQSLTKEGFSPQDFQHWLCVLKENEVSCYPSTIPTSHRSLSFQLACPVIGIKESLDGWDSLEAISLQDELYFSCLAQSCWIRRWLSYLPELNGQDVLSGDRKQVWNEMNMGLHFGKYLQYMTMQLRQLIHDVRDGWRNLNKLDEIKDSSLTQFYVQYTEWITLYEEYNKMRQQPLDKDKEHWFSQLQQAVEEWYTKQSDSSSLDRLLKVPLERKWKQGIFMYVESLANLWYKSMHSVKERKDCHDDTESSRNEHLERLRNVLDNGASHSSSLYGVCQNCLVALESMKKQIHSFWDSNRTPEADEAKDLQIMVSKVIRVAVICDAICCLWWKLTNDMLFTGIKEKWTQSENDTESTMDREYGTKYENVQGTGLCDASIQSMQEANDISDQLDEQDWQEAYEKLGSDKQDKDSQPQTNPMSNHDDSQQSQVDMDNTWQDGTLEEENEEQVEDVESGDGENDPIISDNLETSGLESKDSPQQARPSTEEMLMDNEMKGSNHDDDDLNQEFLTENEKISELKEEYLESTNGEFADDRNEAQMEEEGHCAEEMDAFPEDLENISESSTVQEEEQQPTEETREDELQSHDDESMEMESNTCDDTNWQQQEDKGEAKDDSCQQETGFVSSKEDRKPSDHHNKLTPSDHVEANQALDNLSEQGEEGQESDQANPYRSSNNTKGEDANWILNPYMKSSKDIWKHLLERLDMSSNNEDVKMENVVDNGEHQEMDSLQDMNLNEEEELSALNPLNESNEVVDSWERSQLNEFIEEGIKKEEEERKAQVSFEKSSGVCLREEANANETQSLRTNWEEYEKKQPNEEIERDLSSLQSNCTKELQDKNTNNAMQLYAPPGELAELNSMQVTQELETTASLDEEEDSYVDFTRRVQSFFTRSTTGEKESQLIWQQLLQKTSQDAMLLAERLQMILEPCVTSQLTGSYRTGKRLSMKKVIEFYASDFRKDRIWLRRVQPDRRSYDVLIAIDDSASMMESQASILAMETLALLASSFTRYEIGRLAVARFGNEVSWLRSFEDSLSMEVGGAEILQQFHFKQNATDVAELLRQAIVFLKESKSTSQASIATIQLFFIVSDGRLQNRNFIRKLVREAWENGQLIVFLLTDYVDSKQQSIISLKRVETLENGELKISSYLDDFPFPFYILVRQVESLPQVVASALQEWIEMMNPSRLGSLDK